jgi:hypothetical protein
MVVEYAAAIKNPDEPQRNLAVVATAEPARSALSIQLTEIRVRVRYDCTKQCTEPSTKSSAPLNIVIQTNTDDWLKNSHHS